jgi:hypothetical protein
MKKKTTTVKAHPRKGTKGVKEHPRIIGKRIRKTVPFGEEIADIDNKIIALMLENQLVAKNIEIIKDKLPAQFAPEGTVERVLQKERVKTVKGLQKRQREIKNRIGRLYTPLPKKRRTSIIREFNRKLDILESGGSVKY